MRSGWQLHEFFWGADFNAILLIPGVYWAYKLFISDWFWVNLKTDF